MASSEWADGRTPVDRCEFRRDNAWIVAAVIAFATMLSSVVMASDPAVPAPLDGRYAIDDRESEPVFVRGTIGGEFTWKVRGEYTHGREGKFEQTWVLKRSTPPPPDSMRLHRPAVPRDSMAARGPAPPGATVPRDSTLPRLGEYVRVEELPEAIRKVAPDYPDDARRRGIAGTVTVQALVGRDGRVMDVFVIGSVPGLDEAAKQCVRQWEFKPASTDGKPVAVWVAIPIRFTLH